MDDDDLRREKDIGGDKRTGKRWWDMAVELDDHEAGEEQAEEGEAEALFAAPQHAYTQQLLAAAHLA